eukprot:scaffold96330_cov20-Tisochrysis_lutea.AAC.3
MVKWKLELKARLPAVKVVYYVGQKDERSRKYSQEVCVYCMDVSAPQLLASPLEKDRKPTPVFTSLPALAFQVQPQQFNVLVTTYEYVMRDRAKLCRLEWKYIIIDEAQ